MLKRLALILEAYCYNKNAIDTHVALIRNSSNGTIFKKLGIHPDMIHADFKNYSPTFHASPDSVDY